MGEYLVNRMAADGKLPGWEARSCGVAAERYFPVPGGVRKALAERGITDIKHTPQLVSRELLGWADLVLAMAKGHREMMLDEYPEHTDKIRLFGEEAGWGERDVSDPIGQPVEVYIRCRDAIEDGLRSVVERHGTGKD